MKVDEVLGSRYLLLDHSLGWPLTVEALGSMTAYQLQCDRSRATVGPVMQRVAKIVGQRLRVQSGWELEGGARTLMSSHVSKSIPSMPPHVHTIYLMP
jgi:hypothetical protein